MQLAKNRCFLWCSFLLVSTSLFSQELADQQKKPSLEVQILKMDSLLFDVAFNTCNMELYKKIMATDLEFYDDRSGLNTSFENEIAAFKDRCSKPVSITRKLIRASVHRLGDYGAMQMGTHEFYVDNHKVEKAKFITIWEREGDWWIVKRAISYDHETVSE